MKAIKKPSAAPGFELADVPVPEIGADDVLIKVKLASICGTDVHITQWDEWSASRIKPPLVYGHEFCGVIESVGGHVTHLKPGDYVSAEMHLTCGVCYQCMTGRGHICQDVKIAGIDRDGSYAEYIALPKTHIVPLPDSISPETGACLDSLGNAVHSVSRGDVSGKSVLVTGCGPIGLFSIAVAHALGATQVFASDISEFRLELAQKMGATRAFNPTKDDVPNEIREMTQGRGVDVVLEMAGNERALKTGFDSLTTGGTVILLGIPKAPVTVDISKDIIFKEAKVQGVNGRQIFQTWFLMLDLLTSGRLKLDPLFTHHLPLSSFGEGIELVASGQTGKVFLTP